MNWHERPQKARCRSLAVEPIGDEPADVALFLPSDAQLCVKEALRTGTINHDTTIIAVENKPHVADAIEAFLEDEGFPYYQVYRGHLETFNLAEAQDVEEYGIDLAYIDLCGNFNLKVAKWLVRQKEIFNPGARVSFTFCSRVRQNRLLQTMTYTEPWAGCDKEANPTKDDLVSTFGLPIIERQLAAANTNLGFVGWKEGHISEDHYGAGDLDRSTVEGVFGALNANYKVKIVDCIRYTDTSPMLFVNFHVIEQKETPANRHNCPRASRLLAHAYYEITGQEIFMDKPGRRGRPPTIKKIKIELNAAQKRVKARLFNQYATPVASAKWAWHPQNPNGCRKE